MLALLLELKCERGSSNIFFEERDAVAEAVTVSIIISVLQVPPICKMKNKKGQKMYLT